MSVWTSAGAESRSVAELGMMNLEQMRLVRQSNTAMATRFKEFDALKGEADNDIFQAVTKDYQKEAADYAMAAAAASAISALVGAGVSVASGIGNIVKDSAKVADIVKSAISITQALLSVIGPIMNFLSTMEEVDTLKEQSKAFKTGADESSKRAAALDANPTS